MAATATATATARIRRPFKPPIFSSVVIFEGPKPLIAISRSLSFHGMLKISAGNRPCLSVVRSQSSTDFTPDAKFYKVEAILRPWRVPHVSEGLLKMGILGATVSDVQGFGAQGGSMERQAGSEFSKDMMVAKVKMEIVVSKDQVDAVVEKIIEKARTGEIGDGKIFLIPVSDVIRVRTGERGEKAERMTGGRTDMFTSTTSN